jgi:hypothetical protein
MALGRIVRGMLLAAALVVVVGIVVGHSAAIWNYYHELYPSDPAKSLALEMCFLQDHKFNRIDSDQRDGCYKRALVPVQVTQGYVAAERPEPNAIDMRRAAAAGSMPRNDVRRTEQTENTLKSE